MIGDGAPREKSATTPSDLTTGDGVLGGGGGGGGGGRPRGGGRDFEAICQEREKKTGALQPQTTPQPKKTTTPQPPTPTPPPPPPPTHALLCLCLCFCFCGFKNNGEKCARHTEWGGDHYFPAATQRQGARFTKKIAISILFDDHRALSPWRVEVAPVED